MQVYSTKRIQQFEVVMVAMIALNMFVGCLGMVWGNKSLSSVNFTVAASLFALELAK